MGQFILPTLYLFDNVFYPTTVIPLIISDPPSRKLITACSTEDIPLALWYQSENSKPIGTMGKIISIDERKDGTLKVTIKGIRRVYLDKIRQQIPYPIFEASLYSDIDHGPFNSQGRLEKFSLILSEWLYKHIPSDKERKDFMAELDTPQKLIDHIALLLIQDVEIKQILLECNSLHERMQLIDTLIKSPFQKEDLFASLAIKNFERIDMASGVKN